jgi:hypothetical protein
MLFQVKNTLKNNPNIIKNKKQEGGPQYRTTNLRIWLQESRKQPICLGPVCFCILKVLLKKFKFLNFFSLLQINIFFSVFESF